MEKMKVFKFLLTKIYLFHLLINVIIVAAITIPDNNRCGHVYKGFCGDNCVALANRSIAVGNIVEEGFDYWRLCPGDYQCCLNVPEPLAMPPCEAKHDGLCILINLDCRLNMIFNIDLNSNPLYLLEIKQFQGQDELTTEGIPWKDRFSFRSKLCPNTDRRCCIPQPNTDRLSYELPNCGISRFHERIRHGVRVNERDYPWFVNFYHKQYDLDTGEYAGDLLKLSGVLVHPSWVLTTTKSINRYHNKYFELFVTFGMTEVDDNDPRRIQRSKIKRLVNYFYPVNPGPDGYNDLTLVELETPVKLTEYVNLVCLPNEDEEFDNIACKASGFGALDNYDNFDRKDTANKYLRHVALPIVDISRCKFSVEKISYPLNESKFLCAGKVYDGLEGVCDLDEGTPFVCPKVDSNNIKRFILAGITTYVSPRCNRQVDVFGAFVKVTAYLTWIRQTIGLQSDPSSTSCVKKFKGICVSLSENCPFQGGIDEMKKARSHNRNRARFISTLCPNTGRRRCCIPPEPTKEPPRGSTTTESLVVPSIDFSSACSTEEGGICILLTSNCPFAYGVDEMDYDSSKSKKKLCPNADRRCCIPPKREEDFTYGPGKCGQRRMLHDRTPLHGVPANAGEYPWFAAIAHNNVRVGAGTLIDTSWVLTTALVMDSKTDTTGYEVIFGRISLIDTDIRRVQRAKIKKIIIRDEKDFALLELENPVTLTKYVNLACLPNDNEDFNDMLCMTSGFTRLMTHKPNELFNTALTTVSVDFCKNDLNRNVELDNTKIYCASYFETGKENICVRNKGGPLVCKKKDPNNVSRFIVAGLSASGAAQCADKKDQFAAFIKVTPALPWIKKTIPSNGIRSLCFINSSIIIIQVLFIGLFLCCQHINY